MNEKTREKYGGLIGIGLMFIWACSMLYWVSSHGEVVGLVGAITTSICGTATFFYTNSIQTELRSVSEKNEANKAHAIFWQDQAQSAISKIDSNPTVRQAIRSALDKTNDR